LSSYATQIRERSPVAQSALDGRTNFLDSAFWRSGSEKRPSNFVPNVVGDQLAIDFALVLAFICEAHDGDLRPNPKRRLGEWFGPLAYILDAIYARNEYEVDPNIAISQLPEGEGRELLEAWVRREFEFHATGTQ
jgi:hypothetical protein